MWVAAIAVAVAFWGPPPCTVAYHVAALEPGVLGTAAVSSDGRCEVQIAARQWRWGPLCSVFLHEVGHTWGRTHVDDPMDVMYPMLWRSADACRGKRPPEYPRGAVIRLQP